MKTTLSGGGKEGEEITASEGTGVKDQATLSGENAAKASGTIKYAVYSDSKCEKLVTKAGESSFSGGKVPASEEKKLEAGSVYYWQAEYGGDSLDAASKSPCGKEVLTVKATTALKTTLSGGGKEGEEITVSEGTAIKDKATLSGANAAKATGTVKYFAYADNKCKELVASAGEGAVEGTKVGGSEEKKLEAGAVYYWQAVYGGDASHEGSTSPCGKEILTVKATTSLSTSLVGEGEEGEEIAIATGSEVVDTALLSGTGSTAASGTAVYSVYADSGCEELVTEAGTVSLEGGVIPPSEGEKLEAGIFYWQVVYSGDALHEGSTSPCTEVATVKTGTSLATLLSGAGEEGDEVTVSEGVGVSDTATLSGPGASEATGTVKYSVYSDLKCEELIAEAGEVSVEGPSVPVSSEVTLEPGLYFWQAEYSGDSVNHASASTCGSEIEVVTGAITMTLSGGELSGEEIGILEGTAIGAEATLHGKHSAEATGTVEYQVYSDPECEELVTKAGEVSVEGPSVPVSSEVELSQGTYYWQAEYSGDANNPAAASFCGSVVSVVTTATSLTSSLSGGGKEGGEVEVEEGEGAVGQAVLSGPNASTAGGHVEYAIFSDSKCEELIALAGGGDVSEGSIPPSDEKSLPAGTYYWQAEYSGDGVNDPATSTCGSGVETVAASITTALSGGELSSEEIEVPGETPVSDQATLHGKHAGEASGTVKYFVYADDQCKKLVSKAGESSFGGGEVPSSEAKTLEEGIYYWQAVYSGDEQNPPAESTCGTERLTVADPPRKYAALGDSYSSGEGIGVSGAGQNAYYPRTDQGIPFAHINKCHRSKEAWPALIGEKFYGAGVLNPDTISEQQPASFIFRACRGAIIDNLWHNPPPAGEVGGQFDEALTGPPETWLATPAQDLWLELPGGVLPNPLAPNNAIKLVTATIGGNDAGFAEIADACVQRPAVRIPFRPPPPPYSPVGCQNTIVAKATAGLAAIETKLPVVLKDIHAAAPMARIRIPLYPRIVRILPQRNITVDRLRILQINNVATSPMSPPAMAGLTAARSLDKFVGMLNSKIEETVDQVSEENVPVAIIGGTERAFDGHRLGNANPWVNGVVLPQNGPPRLILDESFHPNRCGHKAVARRVMLDLGEGVPPADCP